MVWFHGEDPDIVFVRIQLSPDYYNHFNSVWGYWVCYLPSIMTVCPLKQFNRLIFALQSSVIFSMFIYSTISEHQTPLSPCPLKSSITPKLE